MWEPTVWEFSSLYVCCCTGHMGLFTRHFFCVDSQGNERLHERELKWESSLQLGKSLEIYVNVYHSSSRPHLKKEHLDNKSSPYKWMRCPEPFELGLICLVAFKRRTPVGSQGASVKWFCIASNVKQDDAVCVSLSLSSYCSSWCCRRLPTLPLIILLCMEVQSCK